jgi:hypothetical protein
VAAQAEAAAIAAAVADETWARRARDATALQLESATSGDGDEMEEAEEARMQLRRTPAAHIAPPITPPLSITPPDTPTRSLDAARPRHLRESLASEVHASRVDDNMDGSALDLDGIPLGSGRKAEQMLEYFHRKAQYRRRVGAPTSADSDISGVSGVSGVCTYACPICARKRPAVVEARMLAWSCFFDGALARLGWHFESRRALPRHSCAGLHLNVARFQCDSGAECNGVAAVLT